MKKLLLFLIIIIILVVAGVATMFFLKICPPAGPWPMPPWCETGVSAFERLEYEVATDAKPLAQIKAVNMFDTWGRNYNFGMMENTQANIANSFDLVKKIGAQEVYVHDFDRAVYAGQADFQSLNYKFEDDIFLNDFRDQAISQSEIKKLAEAAHERGLKLGIKRNITFVEMGKYLLSGLAGTIANDVQKDFEQFNASHSEEWIRDYFAKWQARLVEKAKMYQAAGVDIMSVSPTFQEPTFAGQEALVNSLWRELIAAVRQEFHGQIQVVVSPYGLIDGVDGRENWEKYDYYQSADIVETRLYKLLEKFAVAENPTKEQMAVGLNKMVGAFDAKAKAKGIKLTLFFAPSSYSNAINLGPAEFLDINNQAVKEITADLAMQTNAFDGIFQALSGRGNIARINAGNFSWDDAMDPAVKPRISIAPLFRNKPAEALISIWFNKK